MGIFSSDKTTTNTVPPTDAPVAVAPGHGLLGSGHTTSAPAHSSSNPLTANTNTHTDPNRTGLGNRNDGQGHGILGGLLGGHKGNDHTARDTTLGATAGYEADKHLGHSHGTATGTGNGSGTGLTGPGTRSGLTGSNANTTGTGSTGTHHGLTGSNTNTNFTGTGLAGSHGLGGHDNSHIGRDTALTGGAGYEADKHLGHNHGTGTGLTGSPSTGTGLTGSNTTGTGLTGPHHHDNSHLGRDAALAGGAGYEAEKHRGHNHGTGTGLTGLHITGTGLTGSHTTGTGLTGSNTTGTGLTGTHGHHEQSHIGRDSALGAGTRYEAEKHLGHNKHDSGLGSSTAGLGHSNVGSTDHTGLGHDTTHSHTGRDAALGASAGYEADKHLGGHGRHGARDTALGSMAGGALGHDNAQDPQVAKLAKSPAGFDTNTGLVGNGTTHDAGKYGAHIGGVGAASIGTGLGTAAAGGGAGHPMGSSIGHHDHHQGSGLTGTSNYDQTATHSTGLTHPNTTTGSTLGSSHKHGLGSGAITSAGTGATAGHHNTTSTGTGTGTGLSTGNATKGHHEATSEIPTVANAEKLEKSANTQAKIGKLLHSTKMEAKAHDKFIQAEEIKAAALQGQQAGINMTGTGAGATTGSTGHHTAL